MKNFYFVSVSVKKLNVLHYSIHKLYFCPEMLFSYGVNALLL